MEISRVYDIFYRQKQISFAKGYEIFEKVYKELKNELNLQRKEIEHYGWIEVIITKGE